MRGFTEAHESYFKSGKLQILRDRCTAALQFVVGNSSLPNRKFPDNDIRKINQTIDKIEAQSVFTFVMTCDLSPDNTDLRIC